MSGQAIFDDRGDAGRRLAARLLRYEGRAEVLVLGLPRGGVPVAYEVSRRIGAPLDVLVVRKLGAPLQPELAMGAVASGGVRVLNCELLAELGLDGDFEKPGAAFLPEPKHGQRPLSGNR